MSATIIDFKAVQDADDIWALNPGVKNSAAYREIQAALREACKRHADRMNPPVGSTPSTQGAGSRSQSDEIAATLNGGGNEGMRRVPRITGLGSAIGACTRSRGTAPVRDMDPSDSVAAAANLPRWSLRRSLLESPHGRAE